MTRAADRSRASALLGPLLPEHWPEVRAIYEEGLAGGHATFETTSPEWPEWDAAHLRHSRLVARDGEAVVGWAALSPVGRSAGCFRAHSSVRARRPGSPDSLMRS